MNAFVDYLNSTNNVGGNSTGSLAESQVKSEYYDKVKVDRRIGKYITDSIVANNHHTYILTGHAGDGKTSILVQVLKSLGYIKSGEGLVREKEFDNFYYVKDMSEIAEGEQVQILRKAINSPNSGRSSLLISNTGPLLKTFISMIEEDRKSQGLKLEEAERIKIQNSLLSQLDKNTDSEISVDSYKVIMINVARIDNVNFASFVLKRIVDAELWVQCNDCLCKDKCPIKYNRDLVSKKYDRVIGFIESFYRFLYENDKRMTVRQMVGQLSYAITGNLTCSYIENNKIKEPFFNYNFANLFFGYRGVKKDDYSGQIKGIQQIQLLELDRIALDVDYSLFVNHDYSFFTPDIQEELNSLNRKYRKFYVIEEENAQYTSSQKHEIEFRRAVRRFFLMYSTRDSSDGIDITLNQIFGEHYTEYVELVTKKQPKSMLRSLQNVIFQALYTKNTGVMPSSTQNELPLTLRREDDVFQNVMLVLGRVNKKDLEVIQIPVNNLFEDIDNRQQIALKIQNESFPLSLPMISYFQNLIEGSVSSNYNPALTHGIAKLDAVLLEQFGDEMPENVDDCEIQVIINTTNGQIYERMSLDNGNLNVY